MPLASGHTLPIGAGRGYSLAGAPRFLLFRSPPPVKAIYPTLPPSCPVCGVCGGGGSRADLPAPAVKIAGQVQFGQVLVRDRRAASCRCAGSRIVPAAKAARKSSG